MKISTKGRYGLRALVDLAVNMQEKPVTLAEVARRQKISQNYLEQVFGILRKAGVLKSVKGSGGGYLLARDAKDITVKDVLDVLEGPFSIIDLKERESSDPICQAISQLVWEEINANVNQLLEETTVEDLVKEYQCKQDHGIPMYYI